MNQINTTDCASRHEYIDKYLTTSGPSNDDVCPICNDAWNEEHQEIVSTACNHVYHKECLLTWFSSNMKSSNTCPSCRQVCFQDAGFADSDYDSDSSTPISSSIWDDLGIADEDSGIQEMLEETGSGLSDEFVIQMDPQTLQQRYGINIRDTSDPHRFRQAIDRMCFFAGPFAHDYADNSSELTSVGALTVSDFTLRGLVISAMIERNASLMTPDEWVGMLRELAACRARATDATNIAEAYHYAVAEIQENLHSIWTRMVRPLSTYIIKLTTQRPEGQLVGLHYYARQEDGSLFEEGDMAVLQISREIFSCVNGFGVVFFPAGPDWDDGLSITEFEPGCISQLFIADDTSSVTVLTHRGPSLVLTLRYSDRH